VGEDLTGGRPNSLVQRKLQAAHLSGQRTFSDFGKALGRPGNRSVKNGTRMAADGAPIFAEKSAGHSGAGVDRGVEGEGGGDYG